jgi:hypothetical protein
MTRLRVALGVADSVRMISDQLRAPLPVQIELNAMLDRRAELAAVASDAERRGRFASTEAQQAADDLAELERRAAPHARR